MKTPNGCVNQVIYGMATDDFNIKDYTAIDIDEFLVAKNSVLREYEQEDALAVDQLFEGVPGGNIIFGGMQIRKKKYSDTTTAGVWIGVDSDGIGKINIGDNSDFLLWNGSSLTISGAINASSGTIGGWTIGSTTLTGGGVTLDSAGIITGGIIRTDNSGDRVQLNDATNTLQIYDSSGVIRAESYQNGWEFNSDVGSTRGRIYVDNSQGFLVVQGVSNDIAIGAADDITFIPGNGNTPTAFFDGFTDDFVVSQGDIDILTGDLIIGNTRIVGGGSWTLTLPSTNGSNGEVLHTDGSGDTYWDSVSGGANTSLSNLTTTAVNVDLEPGSSFVDIGQSNNPWDRLYVDDIYLTNGDGTINYNGNVAWDFYASRIELGSTYDDLSPASFASANLGDTNRWNAAFFSTIDVSGTADVGGLRFDSGEDITRSGSDLQYDAGSDHIFYIGGTLTAIIDDNFFTEGDLLANGTKPFVIPHPDGSNRLLRYTAQESPEVLLRHRGIANTGKTGSITISLPTHFTLVTDNTGDVTANLTVVGNHKVWLATAPTNTELSVEGDVNTTFHYEVVAVRDGYHNRAVEIPSNSKVDSDKKLYQKITNAPQRSQAKLAKRQQMLTEMRQKSVVNK